MEPKNKTIPLQLPCKLRNRKSYSRKILIISGKFFSVAGLRWTMCLPMGSPPKDRTRLRPHFGSSSILGRFLSELLPLGQCPRRRDGARTATPGARNVCATGDAPHRGKADKTLLLRSGRQMAATITPTAVRCYYFIHSRQHGSRFSMLGLPRRTVVGRSLVGSPGNGNSSSWMTPASSGSVPAAGAAPLVSVSR